MKIRDQEWESCKCCGQRTKIISDEAYGCDQCGKEIDLNRKDVEYLEAVVFQKEDSTSSERRQFCSWKCCIQNLKKTKSNYFISLPFLKFDTKVAGLRAADFFKLVKP